ELIQDAGDAVPRNLHGLVTLDARDAPAELNLREHEGSDRLVYARLSVLVASPSAEGELVELVVAEAGWVGVGVHVDLRFCQVPETSPGTIDRCGDGFCAVPNGDPFVMSRRPSTEVCAGTGVVHGAMKGPPRRR